MSKRPKRRRDKYNPYKIYKENECYKISFKDGQGMLHKLEISKELFDIFESFELREVSYFNEWDRHLEHSEIYEDHLYRRMEEKQINVEEAAIENVTRQELYLAISNLPEIQRRRIVLHYFIGLTYEEIAKGEGCSFQAVAKTVAIAKKRLKKILK